MKQAKVLTDTEMKRLLAVIANGRHAERNRLAVMPSHRMVTLFALCPIHS